MTLFIWIDVDGKWRVTYLPPGNQSLKVLRVLTTDSEAVDMVFINQQGEEVLLEVQP